MQNTIKCERGETPALPASIDELEERLDEMIKHLVETSVEFADVLRMTFPRFEIVPVQALDTGQVRPRASLYLKGDLDSPDGNSMPPIEFDLFQAPVHIRLVDDVVKTRQMLGKASYKKIAKLLGTSYMTVKRAFDYSRLMEEAGVAVPFVTLTAPPANASRWRHAV